MKKEHFMSSIGYDGMMAVLDKKSFKNNAKKTLKELLDEGSYKVAAAMAVYDDSDEEKEEVIAHYNQKSNSHYTKEQIGRLFGVAKINVKKILML